MQNSNSARLDELHTALDVIRDLADLLEAHPRGHVEMMWIGGPVTAEGLATVQPAFG